MTEGPQAGKITMQPEWSFHCARCLRVEDYHEKRQAKAIKVARLNGWSQTVAEGWICPECVMEARES